MFTSFAVGSNFVRARLASPQSSQHKNLTKNGQNCSVGPKTDGNTSNSKTKLFGSFCSLSGKIWLMEVAFKSAFT